MNTSAIWGGGSSEFRAQNGGKILGRFEIIGRDYDPVYASVVIGLDKLQPDEGAGLVHYPSDFNLR